MSDAILKVRGLEKSFGGLKILKGADFDIERGEKLALIGPNGAGKSTLINTIGGQGPATGGTILFDGVDITKASVDKRLQLGLGRSFQVNNLFWHCDVLMNLETAVYGYNNKLQLLSSFERNKAVREKSEYLLKTVGLWDVRHERPGVLSYGEQRMLEMAMAFAADPKLVLLDEPSAGLPTAEVDEFIRILKILLGDRTVLFCAHDMDLVFALADEIMVLYFGEIIARGTPDEIAKNEKVQEIYLGNEGDTYDETRG